jgi:hypothetical protein
MVVKKAKPTKAVKAKTKAEADGKKKKKKIKEKVPPKPDPLRPSIIMRSIAETLQNCCIDGEFDLPSMLTRTLDKSDPKFRLGLHRETYIPVTTNVSFYDKGSERAMQIFDNQATVVSPALIGEGIPRREKEFNPPFCKEHK